MSGSAHRRDSCRLCDGRDLELVLPLTPTPLADEYVPKERLDKPQPAHPLDLYLCRRCGFSQISEIVHAEEIYLDYLYDTASSLGLVEHFQQYAGEVAQRLTPPRGSLAVDIGSNDGALLRAFQTLGMRVLGVDPAREIARRATEAGLETLPTFFTPDLAAQIKKERGPASIVTANNVFANVDDLSTMTTGVRELLAPNGVFVFESFYLADQIANMVFDFTYHEHLSYFSVKPLVAFFLRHGMELIDADRVPTKGGSLRYSVQRAGGPRPVSLRVAALIDHETAMGIHGPKAFVDFTCQIDERKAELRARLEDLRARRKSIAGYGASPTTTTLVYHFGLAEFLSFIADDNPVRQGLYSPGYHIPVRAPKSLYDEKVDWVVVLAWRYHEPIMRKHPAFLQQGGHFIVPLPSVRVF